MLDGAGHAARVQPNHFEPACDDQSACARSTVLSLDLSRDEWYCKGSTTG